MGPQRRRNRKRKRRIVSDSSSSEKGSSSSSDSSDASTPIKAVALEKPAAPDTDDSEETSTSSEESQEDSDAGVESLDRPSQHKPKHPEPPLQRDSPSPQPVVDIPPFIPPNAPESELALKEKFRKFWMASIAEGFKDDLEEIRKEPNLGPSRLALLIDSLALGADVFSSSSMGGSVNEMEVVLDQLS